MLRTLQRWLLDSVKSRFGILFAKSGISGAGKARYAELEQLKVFQDRGIVIVVISLDNREEIAAGANLITLLRRQYEAVRGAGAMRGKITKRSVDALKPAGDGAEAMLWDTELKGFGVRVQRGGAKSYVREPCDFKLIIMSCVVAARSISIKNVITLSKYRTNSA